MTRPFVFAGASLSMNLATSAAGYVRVRLRGQTTTLESEELFGDSLERVVEFEGGTPAQLAGEPVVMELTMSDADVYSFQFV